MRNHLKILSIGSAVGATALFANGALGHASTPPVNTGVAVGNSPTQRQVVLGDAATAVLDTLNGQVVVVALVPHPGWSVASIQPDDDFGLDVRLSSTAGASVEFDATTEGGALGVVPDDDDGSDDDGTDDDGTDDDGFDDDGGDD